MKTIGMSGGEAILRILRTMGVERIFASPGSDWAPLWDALAKPYQPGEIPEYISARHEETAAAMAIGYSKATGKLPALVLHTTVGALHATMALRAALHERIPMVVMAGESIAFAEAASTPPGRQWLRLLSDVGGPARLVESCVKWSFGLNTGVLLPHTIQRACQLAMAAPRGPVFVSVPLEFMLEPLTNDPPAVAGHASAPAANAAAVEALARELAAAKNPVILTEEVGKSIAAVEHLVALAETLAAPVVEPWQPTYVNFPHEHPLYCGVAVTEMAEMLKGADLVFLVESVGPWHPPSSLPAPGTRVAVLGEDPFHSHLPFWGFRADLVVAGDPEASLAMLVGEVRKLGTLGSRAGMIERWRSCNDARRAANREAARSAGMRAAIETSWVAHELDATLPPDAIVVNETITHRLDVIRVLDRLAPGSYFEASYGGLGMGIGMALGVKDAHPDRTVVNLIGDGAFHYNPVVGSFGAAQEHGLPILVVLFDNAGYRSQKGDVISEFPDGWAVKANRFAGTSITPRPDYALLARAYGGYGETVSAPGEVRAALKRGLDAIAKGQLALIVMQLAPVNPQDLA